jgi:UDP-glucose 4-epimerase/UDP-glucuronate decarboxylase
MKILVTGGAGFIGFHLSNYLADGGAQVVICDNLFRGRADEDFNKLLKRHNVKFINIDLTEKQKLDALEKEFDIVYHLAAINGTRYFYEIPHEVLRVNILSLINILDWLRDTKCKRMVWTSSSETYAGTFSLVDTPIPTPEEVPLTIADVSNPRFSYAGSKIAGELLCLSYAKAYDLDVGIVRPHNIYGPRMGYEHVIPQFIKRIIKRENPFKIYGGHQSRTFCFIEDCVKGLKLVGESAEIGTGIVNIGNNKEEISIKNLAHKMFDIFDFHPKLEVLPPPEGSVDRRCPDISKAKMLVGYEPQIHLDQGLQITYDWYLKHAMG